MKLLIIAAIAFGMVGLAYADDSSDADRLATAQRLLEQREAAAKQPAALQARIDELIKKNKQLSDANTRLLTQVADLKAQVVKLQGQIPKPVTPAQTSAKIEEYLSKHPELRPDVIAAIRADKPLGGIPEEAIRLMGTLNETTSYANGGVYDFFKNNHNPRGSAAYQLVNKYNVVIMDGLVIEVDPPADREHIYNAWHLLERPDLD